MYYYLSIIQICICGYDGDGERECVRATVPTKYDEKKRSLLCCAFQYDADWIRLSVRAYVIVRMNIGVCVCMYVCVCMFTSIQCCFEGHLEKVEWQKNTYTRT